MIEEGVACELLVGVLFGNICAVVPYRLKLSLVSSSGVCMEGVCGTRTGMEYLWLGCCCCDDEDENDYKRNIGRREQFRKILISKSFTCNYNNNIIPQQVIASRLNKSI